MSQTCGVLSPEEDAGDAKLAAEFTELITKIAA
jgi:hypothetical protein